MNLDEGQRARVNDEHTDGHRGRPPDPTTVNLHQ